MIRAANLAGDLTQAPNGTVVPGNITAINLALERSSGAITAKEFVIIRAANLAGGLIQVPHGAVVQLTSD